MIQTQAYSRPDNYVARTRACEGVLAPFNPPIRLWPEGPAPEPRQGHRPSPLKGACL